MQRLNTILKRPVTREELFNILKDNNNPERVEYTNAYLETQRESLVGAAKAIRDGIDAVDPSIQGINCAVGHTTEFGAEMPFPRIL